MSVRGATTAKERQLYYLRQEMESTHRRRNVYPKDSEKWKEWNNRYESAVRTWNELTGMKLEAMK